MDFMNRAQRLLHELVRDQQVHAKGLAFRLHKHADFICDILRREHVDYTAIFNEILRSLDARLRAGDLTAFDTAREIFQLFTDGTHFVGMWIQPAAPAMPFEKLCAQTGELLKDLGGAIEALAVIESDGKVDEGDDARIAEFTQKVEAVSVRLKTIMHELQRRRAEKASKT